MKIAVLVSGGVDSTVALRLLKDQGHQVTAFYLKIWLEDELSYLGNCPWQEDLDFVHQVCQQADVPLQIMSLQQEYWDHVVTYTIAQIKAGKTPNPDIMCNKEVKFGFFIKKLTQLDPTFDKIATGHYAQVVLHDGKYLLKAAPDQIKDQTYFLSHLSQDQLARALFPIGHLQKFQVRELAQQYDVANKDRKDSQGICFLGKLKFADFIKHYLGQKQGDLIEYETGKKLGNHNGYWFYTIGQRQGTGLSGGPWYVVKKDMERNVVYVSRAYYDADKKRNTFAIGSCNWIAGTPPDKQNVVVKLRHGKNMVPCKLQLIASDAAHVELASDDQGIAAGQFAVFYDNDLCLGSGIIQ